MKTILSKKIYSIDGIDESGLIPEGAGSAIVSYDNSNKPNSIHFTPKAPEIPGFKDGEERFGEDYRKMLREITDKMVKDSEILNPTRTRDEIISIVNALEKALE